MFELDSFLADLTACLAEGDPRRAAKEIVARAMTTPGDVAAAIASPAGGITLLHHQPELTVINVTWPPKMQLMPHDHRMWALIGIYGGVEDNQFFRRGEQGHLVETTGRRLDTGDVLALGTETIHSVTNPIDRLTGAVHVYGGDFVNQPRSQWGPGDRVEQPYDMVDVNRQFDDANRAAGLTATS